MEWIEAKTQLPFSTDNFRARYYLNKNSTLFFDSYNSMGFKAILEALLIHPDVEKSETLQDLVRFGTIDFFEDKFDDYVKTHPDNKKTITFYHALLERHMRQQLMERMGEMSIREKLPEFLHYLNDVLLSFSRDADYLHQIKHYFKYSSFAEWSVGKLRLAEVDRFLKMVTLTHDWVDADFNLAFKSYDEFNDFLHVLSRLEKRSGLKYNITSVFDLQLHGLSTGERQFLKLFSRLLNLDLTNYLLQRGITSIILLIDEFELGFHPLWQQQFLSKLIRYLEIYHDRLPNQPTIQLVITSHSPFVVSDLPKECVCFLSRKGDTDKIQTDQLRDHNRTFGANIHSLLSDSFFLHGAHMGHWATFKINKAFKELMADNEMENEQLYRAIIDMVGEPLIRLKLEEMLSQKSGGNIELQRLRAQQEFINYKIDQILKADDPDKK